MSLDHHEFDAHQQVSFFHDEATGLQAIVALHRVRSGKALGGIRFFNYPDPQAALTDVLRLSRAMSYKWALAGFAMGGGKAVVLLAKPELKTEALLQALGRCVQSLGGRYICAPDMGSTPEDMAVIRRVTPHVAGLPGANTAIPTALGLFHGLRAIAKAVLDADQLDGVRIAIQGAGGVGGRLCRHLADAGAQVLVADVNAALAQRVAGEVGAQVCDPSEVLAAEVDIVSPCATGAVINQQSIPLIKAKAICGAANNQLATPADADRLMAAGITWAPDYVVSAGGIIGGTREMGMIDEAQCQQRLENIYVTTMKVLDLSRTQGLSTDAAAQALAAPAVNGTDQ